MIPKTHTVYPRIVSISLDYTNLKAVSKSLIPWFNDLYLKFMDYPFIISDNKKTYK